jgi:Uma2 family endonuclease
MPGKGYLSLRIALSARIEIAMPFIETKLITADELLMMSNLGRCELMYGEIIRMSPAGAEHGMVASRFNRFLAEFVEQHELGVVFAAETGFVLERDPDVVRAPDTSFVRKDRIAGKLTEKYFEGAPDLAVEVNSPNDTRKEVADKVNMWLARGTSVVWEAEPRLMTVIIHRVGKNSVKLGSSDEIRDEPLLPAFVLPLTRVFRLP